MHKGYRLQKNEDYRRIYRKGKSTANRQLVLYYFRNQDTPHYRLGISISKKIGKAVVRNRLKRVLKHIVQAYRDRIPGGYDLVIIVRQNASQADYKQLCQSVLHLLKKARLYK